MMHTGIRYLSCTLLTIHILNKIVLANEIKDVQLKPQSNTLSFLKELTMNSIYLVNFQSALMIKASTRDFAFNIPSNTKLNYIRYPQSYHATSAQFSSNMYKVFMETHSTMNRIELAVKGTPNHIKTMLRLLNAESSVLAQRMFNTSLNSITRLSNENILAINKTIDNLNDLLNFSNEIQLYTVNLFINSNSPSSDKTDLIMYNEVNLKNMLEKISMIIQQMKQQFKHVTKLIMSLDMKTKYNLTIHDKFTTLIPILYTVEDNAYFLHQISSIYTNLLHRYVLDQAAGMGKYLFLSTDEERSREYFNLSEAMSKTLNDIEQLFIVRQNEFEMNSIALQQAYEKLLNEVKNRLSKSLTIE